MKKQKINLPIDGEPYPVEIKPIKHRDGTETLFCWCKLDNDKKVKMEAHFTPLNPPDENGHQWAVKCHGMETHSNARWGDACHMFVFHIQVANSMIEADKYIEVKVRIPKNGGCECCPLFLSDEAEDSCRYLNVIIVDTKKDKNCPAIKN